MDGVTSNENNLPEEVNFSNSVIRDPLVDTTLDGRFIIEEVLGSGGMSIVYKARQLRVNRHVAIKTLRMATEAKPIYKERFEREISSLCALSHPNIVTVYDCIIGPDDQPYVVMDYLRGRSLEALIKSEGPMVVGRFANIAMQICSALDHAHKKGIVHRDLKPGNIVLIDDETDFVKVVDFGLAKQSLDNRNLTQSGELWGSPPYMSPEQCLGESGDNRSDIYSIGAVMYEMIVGKDPFNGAHSVFDFIQRHIHASPPPFFQSNPNVNVSMKLEGVIFKALEKSPLDRFQTAQELQDAIVEACSEDSGNLIYHPSRAGRTTATGIETGVIQDADEQSLQLQSPERSQKSQQMAWFAGMMEAGSLSDSMAIGSSSDLGGFLREAITEVASGDQVSLKLAGADPLNSEVQSLTAQENANVLQKKANQVYAPPDSLVQNNSVFQQTNNNVHITNNVYVQNGPTKHSLLESSSADVQKDDASPKPVAQSNLPVWALLTLVLLVSLACMSMCMPKQTESSATSDTAKHSDNIKPADSASGKPDSTSPSSERRHRRPKISPSQPSISTPDEPTNQSTDIEFD